MAYRKTTRRKFQPSSVLPIWSTTHTDTVNLAVLALLSKFGITDVPSYFLQFRIPIAISVVVCACIGAANYGIKGFVLGGLVGLLAPAALVWGSVLLVAVAVFLGLYVLAWTAIWVVFQWALSEFFRF